MIICVDDWNGQIRQVLRLYSRTIVFYTGGNWGAKCPSIVCLVIKSQLHKVIWCKDWRSTGTEKRFTLFIEPKRTYIQ